MENKRPTVYEECRQKGITRRDFLKFCTTMAALMGLESTGVAQVVNALETKPRLPIIWLHLQECTCCTESFIRAAHPIVATLLLDKGSLYGNVNGCRRRTGGSGQGRDDEKVLW